MKFDNKIGLKHVFKRAKGYISIFPSYFGLSRREKEENELTNYPKEIDYGILKTITLKFIISKVPLKSLLRFVKERSLMIL